MDTQAMLYIFGPLIAYSIGVGIAFGIHSYLCFTRGNH
jgi:hypothetical protein